MFSIKEVGLDYYIPVSCQEKYKKIAYSALPLEERIVQLLTINPEFMVKSATISDEENYKKLKYNSSVQLIKEKISLKKKLEFFSLSLNVKPHIKEITNGLIYPDVADFLTLLHLNIVFKYINEIYAPGALLRIGSQFNYFRKFSRISQDAAKQMHTISLKFNSVAEDLVGTNNLINIFDVYEAVEPFKKEFYLKVEGAKFDFLQEEGSMNQIRKSAEYYVNYVVDPDYFPNKEAAWNFCMYHVLDSTAYKTAIVSMFDTSHGLFERFSELIQVETRFQSGSNVREHQNSIYIAFLPGASTFSFNRLTLRKTSGLWELTTYKQITKVKAKEKFIKQLSHPFFFEEIPNGKSI